MLPKKASLGNHRRAYAGRTVQGKELKQAILNTQTCTVIRLGKITQKRVRKIMHSSKKIFGSCDFLCHMDQACFRKRQFAKEETQIKRREAGSLITSLGPCPRLGSTYLQATHVRY